jgi:hypothetical protein
LNNNKEKQSKTKKPNSTTFKTSWSTIKRPNLQTIGVDREEQTKGIEIIFNKTVAENFPNLGTEISKYRSLLEHRQD